MTDKEFLAMFLGRYQRALAKIAALEQREREIKSGAVSLHGVDVAADKVKTGKKTDGIMKSVVSVISIGEQIADLRQKLPALRKNTALVIGKLPFTFQGGLVLEVHFIDGYPLTSACSVLGISREQVYSLYNKSLAMLLNLPEVRELLGRYADRLRENKRRRMEKSRDSGENPRE